MYYGPTYSSAGPVCQESGQSNLGRGHCTTALYTRALYLRGGVVVVVVVVEEEGQEAGRKEGRRETVKY